MEKEKQQRQDEEKKSEYLPVVQAGLCRADI